MYKDTSATRVSFIGGSVGGGGDYILKFKSGSMATGGGIHIVTRPLRRIYT